MRNTLTRFLIGNVDKEVLSIQAGSVQLTGHLAVPKQAQGLVVLPHGSGSSRTIAGNQYIAEFLRNAGLATLLVELLTPTEEDIDLRCRHFRCDIGLLAERLVQITDWLMENFMTRHLQLGYFCTDYEAGAALMAATQRPDVVKAIACRGAWPELVIPIISQVKAPTLLLVGENDLPGIAMNEDALTQLQVEKRLDVIPNASHLFEEPGALETIGQLSVPWFQRYLV
jgi:putative phosphoribosyl transferase